MRFIVLVLCSVLLVGCGKPSIEDRPTRPSEILDFNTLYAQRCAGCHGNDGAGSGSIALHDPALLNIIDKDTLRILIRDGREGTLMPSFQSNTGNPLTNAQIDVIVDGMIDNWKTDVPPWAKNRRYAVKNGKATRGRGAFADMCGKCHGTDGMGGTAGSVIMPAFLDW
jgi:Cytochrome c, mono- and diheme variants